MNLTVKDIQMQASQEAIRKSTVLFVHNVRVFTRHVLTTVKE
jgi:hypothetical protein